MSIANLILVLFILKKKENDSEELNEKEDYDDSFLCRFVLDGFGNKIGESIALDGDVLIIKSGRKYLGVPLKHIEEKGDFILVKGLIERDKAELLGEKWRQESFREIGDKEVD